MKEKKISLLEKIADLIGKKEEGMDFAPKKYVMKEVYDAKNLVIGNLKYISSEVTDFGPKVKRTKKPYIFEQIEVDGKTRYQEVFTGFIVKETAQYFDLPYIVDVEKLIDILPEYTDAQIPKLGMLLTMDEVNEKKIEEEKLAERRLKNINFKNIEPLTRKRTKKR